MATVTGLTAARMLAIEAASVVDGDIVGDDLILTKHDGTQINAGDVRGPAGPTGPVGSDTVLTMLAQVLDVGLVNQIRAGRQLTADDFTDMGLSAPIGLWNLSNLTDVSGNGRNLLNKGAVTFDKGINGLATTAAKFVGSTAQALYIADTGASDPFRIKVGSWGCWFKTAKRGTAQALISKVTAALPSATSSYLLDITTSNTLRAWATSPSLSDGIAAGLVDVADDRWHFAVCVHDGAHLRLYVDGVLDAVAALPGTITPTALPFNIGGIQADASTAANSPHFGRVDEAFVSSDVLSEDQVRNLYCVRIDHGLLAVPSRMSVNVRRRRKGGALVSGDFPSQPVRLHNFSAGSLADAGSGGVALTNNGTALAVAGVDGTRDNAFHVNGAQTLSSTDAGLPAALTARSYGCWLKTISLSAMGVLAWGTLNTADARIWINTGIVSALSGADSLTGIFAADGQWHHVVCVEDNSASDGVKRKLYMDGRLVGGSTVMTSLTLAGANRFRIGASSDGTNPFTGQVDSAFVSNVALTFEEVAALYAKGSGSFGPSPKNPGDHIELFESTHILATFDTLECTDLVDLGVAV